MRLNLEVVLTENYEAANGMLHGHLLIATIAITQG